MKTKNTKTMKSAIITPRENAIKVILIILLFVVLMLKSMLGNAQRQIGLEAQFGVQSFSIESNIETINGMNVLQEGGTLGVVYGGNAFRTHLQLAGFYYSAASVKRTVDQFRTGFYTTIHPVALMTGNVVKVSPYVVTGASYTDLRFFGHYLNNADAKVNYSTTQEPYIGSIKRINGRVGLGLEWNKHIGKNFIQVFGEGVYAAPLVENANREVLKGTSATEMISFHVGVRAGLLKR